MPVIGSNFMKLTDIRDKNIVDYDKSNLELSVLFKEDGLSFSLMVLSEMRYVMLRSFNFVTSESYVDQCNKCLSEVLSSDDKFSNVRLVIADNRQTIVPEALFAVSDIEKYWKLNFSSQNDCEIHSYNLTKSQACVIFPVKKDLQIFINSINEKKSIVPSSASFIDFNFKRNRLFENPEKSRIYIQVYETFAEFLLIENYAIKLFNTFEFKTQNDLLYHIINVFEQLKISQKYAEVVFSGFIETDSLVVLNVKKFVSEVYFESQNIGLRYYYRFQEIAPHYYFYLLNY